jgi:hypothetical protein
LARKSPTAACHPTLDYGDFDFLFAKLATLQNIVFKISVQGANTLPVSWRLPCLQPSSPPCCSTAVSQLTPVMFSKMAPAFPEETLKHASMSLIRHFTLSWPTEYRHCRLECCLPVFYGRLELFRRTLLGTTPLLRGLSHCAPSQSRHRQSFIFEHLSMSLGRASTDRIFLIIGAFDLAVAIESSWFHLVLFRFCSISKSSVGQLGTTLTSLPD